MVPVLVFIPSRGVCGGWNILEPEVRAFPARSFLLLFFGPRERVGEAKAWGWSECVLVADGFGKWGACALGMLCPPAPALGDRPGSLLGIWWPWGDPSVRVQPISHCSFSLELAVLCAWTAFRTLPSVNALAGLWGGGGGELRALGVTGLCLRWEAGGLRASKSSGESSPLPCATRTSEGWARTTAASPGRGLRGSSQAGLGEAGSERPSDVCLRCSRLRDVTPGGPGEVPGVC